MSLTLVPSADGNSAAFQISGVTRATLNSTGAFIATSFSGDGSGLTGIAPAPATPATAFGIGQSWQAVTRTSGVTYYNTTLKPIMWCINLPASSTASSISIGGLIIGTISSPASSSECASFVIPPAAAYGYVQTTGTSTHTELR